MASSMEIRSKPFKLAWLYLPFMLLHSSIGCMSIRNAPPVGLPRVANCSDIHPGLADPGENFPLYDRHGILQKWDSCKERSAIWVSNQWCRCEAAKVSLHCWIHAKKEAVIAPPWPHFHPVPTKPVFEPEEKGSSTTPESYGRFGKG